MLQDLLIKNGTNLLKTGTLVLITTLTQQALRDSSKDTIENITKDVRRIKYEYTVGREAIEPQNP